MDSAETSSSSSAWLQKFRAFCFSVLEALTNQMFSAETSSSSSAVVPAQQQSIPGKIPWPEAPSIVQNFSLPPSIMYYMAKNPSSPELYNKMIKSCKYFFEKNPILVVANMLHYMHGNSELKICSNANCTGSGLRCCTQINFNNISSKFWLTHDLDLNFVFATIDDAQHFTSLLRPKIYRCDVGAIQLTNTHVMYENFKFLAASAIDVELFGVKMFHNDGKDVALESIIEAVPKIKNFTYGFSDGSSIINASTMKNITKLMDPGQLETFSVYHIPSNGFNVDDLSAFIQDYKDTKIWLEFNYNISEEYKARLDGLVDTVIASEVSNSFIEYNGQNRGKRRIMYARYSL